MRRTALAIALALLVALAGCGDQPPGETAVETTGATTGAPPAPTTAPNPTAERVAPGVTTEGVRDAFALADAHRAALSNTTFTVAETTTVRYVNGTLAMRADSWMRVNATAPRVHTSTDVRGPLAFALNSRPGHSEYWGNETAALVRWNTTRGIESGEGFTSAAARVQYATRWTNLVSLLVRSETAVLANDSGNGARVVSDSLGEYVDAGGRYANATNATVALRVTPGGFVPSYTVTYHTVVAGESVVVTRSVAFTNVGDTTVERPSWVGDAAA
ncbi:hypothetical protein [Salarchaeum sp. JOR-1]|uniref:hypothetical protein n=1 Tax=Salarchaeum sp. JOR-1 TaxID=2599399 RepID=UPI0011989DCE|nr:hypothetical protein [Salarchaeum sp. JOR-1]QDX41534.1 hypothetical protein FQU85_11710 [Salarchaeum sp. JOR-1]